ncbi:MAG: hypothetical protein CTY20_08380 [Hyphomicrobium sp.]|nr:MAG: hypothetical protein CTY20_08380 [Hyphomicrobium sp.]
MAATHETPMIILNTAQWAEVRRLYESGEGTVHGIAQAFGISDRNILYRAKRESWLRRAGVRGLQVGDKGPNTPVPPGHPTRAVRQALIRRLYKAIDMKLKHWEDRMARGEDLTAADSERMAKEITTMINGFETVAETEGAIEKRDAQSAAGGTAAHGRPANRRGRGGASSAGGAPATPDVSVAADAERMRIEIAERLERLRNHCGNAGSAE